MKSQAKEKAVKQLVGVMVPPEVIDRLRQVAEERDWSISKTAAKLIERALIDIEKEAA